jgi:hypothetical protein
MIKHMTTYIFFILLKMIQNDIEYDFATKIFFSEMISNDIKYDLERILRERDFN